MKISVFAWTDDSNPPTKQLRVHRISSRSEEGERGSDDYREEMDQVVRTKTRIVAKQQIRAGSRADYDGEKRRKEADAQRKRDEADYQDQRDLQKP